MIKLLTGIAWIVLAVGCNPKIVQKENMIIKGQVFWKEDYCGGAPPDEMGLENVEKPLASYEVSLRSGLANNLENPIVKNTRTDADGRFELEVPRGQYVLIGPYQKDKSLWSSLDKNLKIVNHEGLNNWWISGLASVDGETFKDLVISLQHRCHVPVGVPYVRYTGPMAP